MAIKKSDTFMGYNEIYQMLKRYGYSFNQTQLKDCLQAVMQAVMDIEVSQILDASRYERNTTRRAYRNGYRSTMWNTPIGNIELRVPKLRRGTYYPDQLLNDSKVSDLLLYLIGVSILQGVDENHVAETLSSLDFLSLSPYELHQVCDVIRLQVELPDSDLAYNGDKMSYEHLAIPYRKYRLLNRSQQMDNEFWQDFARRLVHAGLIVDNEQSVLSSVNPYASLQLDDRNSIVYLDFADMIYPLYIEDYQLIA